MKNVFELLLQKQDMKKRQRTTERKAKNNIYIKTTDKISQMRCDNIKTIGEYENILMYETKKKKVANEKKRENKR